MKKDPLRNAARLLGSAGGKAPKTITEPDRQRRRDWARGLAALRKTAREVHAKQAVLSHFVVIDRRGRKWPYAAESVQHAVTLARLDGIDAVAGRAEPTKGKQ